MSLLDIQQIKLTSIKCLLKYQHGEEVGMGTTCVTRRYAQARCGTVHIGKEDFAHFFEHRTSNIEHRTSNIEHRTSNIEHRTGKS
jgi:hypothetical protein